MSTALAASATSDSVVRLLPGGNASLAQLSDDELLANTRRLVGKTNQLLAALLVHLAEVEARGVHRLRSCASLYTYCIYELRFSEDAAARRSAAARFVKEFPALLDAVANGELHLTGLLMIGPHLTAANQGEVLGRAKFRTKKELSRLVRDLNPLPGVPDCLEPLGPERAIAWRKATRDDFIDGLLGPVRNLPEGERPGEWANDGSESDSDGSPEANENEDALPVGPVPADLPPVTKPQHYGLQFTTVQQHVELIEKAKALLARERPGITLGELHLEAMRAFVASLEKRKFAMTAKPGRSTAGDGAPRQRGAAEPDHDPQPDPDPNPQPELEPEPSPGPTPPRQRRQRRTATTQSPSRYIPAATQRELYERDDARCAYVDARGERCKEARFLEIHHVDPFGKGGGREASNLTLHCAAHNALAAEQDFGKEHIAARRNSARHESLRRQKP